MEWLTTRTWEYKVEYKKCWHTWFAWHPIVIKRYPDGYLKKLWLTRVLRKGEIWTCWDDQGFNYEYKKIVNEKSI